MKRTLLVLGIITAVVASVCAQPSAEQRVKILPAKLSGAIKIHYAMSVNEPLEITFFNEEGEVLGKDKIAAGRFPKGFSKRYDIHKINHDDFWVKINSAKQAIVYHIVPSEDRQTFTAMLEPASNQLLVKANN